MHELTVSVRVKTRPSGRWTGETTEFALPRPGGGNLGALGSPLPPGERSLNVLSLHVFMERGQDVGYLRKSTGPLQTGDFELS